MPRARQFRSRHRPSRARLQQGKKKLGRRKIWKGLSRAAAASSLAWGSQILAVPVQVDLTPHLQPGETVVKVRPSQELAIDLDGTTDLDLYLGFRSDIDGYDAFVGADASVIADPNNPSPSPHLFDVNAARLDAGSLIPDMFTMIGATAVVRGLVAFGLNYGAGTGDGNFFNLPMPKFVGFEYFSSTDMSSHAGWAQINVTYDGQDPVIELYRAGYESDPLTQTTAGAPEPGGLALLALGAAGMAARRRERIAAR